MCAGAAVLSRVERVVFAAYDDEAGAVGSLWDVVRDRRLNHRPEVIAGVLAARSTALLDDFFSRQRDFGRTDDVR
jgi:tRNA(adenine34) deaminase